jgi:tRNA threonylcarbamoyladenosine biosynthesis protein TsaB
MNVLGFDTATPATAVCFLPADGDAVEARHDPAPGERPGHAAELLTLIEDVLARAGARWEEVDLLAVGTGPGTFTGLRIGIATARALAQARELPLVGIGTLRALAEGALAEAASGDRPVLAVLDARRGEAFAAAWAPGDPPRELLAPAALTPQHLAERVVSLPATALAIGDGALEFRAFLQEAGAEVPPDGSPLHRVAARHLCRLARTARPPGRDAVLPDYVRLPDAELAARRTAT